MWGATVDQKLHTVRCRLCQAQMVWRKWRAPYAMWGATVDQKLHNVRHPSNVRCPKLLKKKFF